MERLRNSFTGIIIGIVLIIAGIGLLIFNESNNVKNIKTVDEIREVAIDIDSTYDATNDGKLVNFSDEVVTDASITDSIFNITVDGVKLYRTVEIYQWVETTKKEDDKTIYEYHKEWMTYLVDSSGFNNKTYDLNPVYVEYQEASFVANTVTIGDFILSDYQIGYFSANNTVTDFSEATLPEGYTTQSNYILNGSLSNPEVGTIRISFSYADPSDATVLGEQQGTSIVDYVSEAGKTVNKVSEGVKTASVMIDEIEDANNFIKWALRIGGALAIIIGISMLFGPITALADFIPFVGELVGFVVFIASFLVGSAIALIVIAISWIAFRPVIGIGLLIGAAILVYLFITLARKNKPQNNDFQVNQ